MPRVTLRSSHDGETLSEYLCDWPDCPNVAEHVAGAVRELGQFVAMCSTHAASMRTRRRVDSTRDTPPETDGEG